MPGYAGEPLPAQVVAAIADGLVGAPSGCGREGGYCIQKYIFMGPLLRCLVVVGLQITCPEFRSANAILRWRIWQLPPLVVRRRIWFLAKIRYSPAPGRKAGSAAGSTASPARFPSTNADSRERTAGSSGVGSPGASCWACIRKALLPDGGSTKPSPRLLRLARTRFQWR